MQKETSTAKSIFDFIESAYKPTHEYRSVQKEDFQHLDLRFYENIRTEFEVRRFRFLDDIEDVTLRNVPNNVMKPVMIRSMVSERGDIMAGIYHPRVKFWISIVLFLLGKSLGKVIDLETEFNNGMFLVTSNAESASMIESPPLIFSNFFPKNTGIDVLLDFHLKAIDQFYIIDPTIKPVVITSRYDVEKSQNRMNAIKSAYRGEIGGLSMEELQQLNNGMCSPKQMERLQEELGKLNEQKR